MTRRRILIAVALAISLSLTQASGSSAATAQCGEVITQDLRLDNDIVDCQGPGLVIGASGITLDLHGHTIDGTQRREVQHVGIDDSGGFDGVVIKNGTVREFEIGIRFQSVQGAELRRVSVNDNNQIGLEMISSGGNHVIRSEMSGNGFGIELRTAASLQPPEGPGSNDNLIERCTFADDGGGGIVMVRSDRNTARYNVLTRDAAGNEAALAVYGGTGNRIERNSMVGNPQRGIYVSGAGPFGTGEPSVAGLIWHNTVSQNFDGVVVDQGATETQVERNSVTDNRRIGIGLLGPRNTASRNRVLYNGTDGYVGAGGIMIGSTGNIVENNLSRRNTGDGILTGEGFLFPPATGALIIRNRSNENSDDGIQLKSPGNTVTQNRTLRNVDLGIEAVVGSIDGGGNRARRNGNPAQCLNLTCR